MIQKMSEKSKKEFKKFLSYLTEGLEEMRDYYKNIYNKIKKNDRN